MKTSEAVKEILKQSGTTQLVLAKRLNMDRRAVGMRLSNRNLSIKVLREMLAVLGYKIVIMPDTVPTPKEGMEIEE